MLKILASMQPFIGAYAQSDLPGKLIIWSLAALSVLCWIILIYKIWEPRKVKIASAKVLSLIERNKDHLLSFDASFFSPFMPGHIPHPFPEIYFVLKDKAVEILNKKMFFLEKTAQTGEVYLTSNDIEVLEQCVS